MPKSAHLRNIIKPSLTSYKWGSKTRDLLNSWPVILIGLGVSIMMGIVLMLVMRVSEGVVIWGLVYCGLGSLLALAVYLMVPGEAPSSTRILEILASLFLLLVTVIIMLVLCYRQKDIQSWLRMMHTANKLITSDQLMFVFPLAMSLITMVLIAVWVTVGLSFYSTGEYLLLKDAPYPVYALKQQWRTLSIVYLGYVVWGMVFLVDASAFIVTGFALNWYYRVDGCFERARTRFWKYHMGSVVLGALMSILIGPIKFVFDFVMVRASVT